MQTIKLPYSKFRVFCLCVFSLVPHYLIMNAEVCFLHEIYMKILFQRLFLVFLWKYSVLGWAVPGVPSSTLSEFLWLSCRLQAPEKQDLIMKWKHNSLLRCWIFVVMFCDTLWCIISQKYNSRPHTSVFNIDLSFILKFIFRLKLLPKRYNALGDGWQQWKLKTC